MEDFQEHSRKVRSDIRRPWHVWPLYVALTISAVRLGTHICREFCVSRDTTCPEGSIVYSIQAIQGPAKLYRDYNRPPYATTPYMPLYYLVSAQAASWLGSDVEAYYRGGRLITVLSVVGALGAVFASVRRSHGETAAFVAAGSATTLAFLHDWCVTCRPDMLALALALAGLVEVQRDSWRGDALGTIAFLFSMLTKQSFLAAPAAAFIWLCLRHQFRRAIQIMLAIAAGVACTVVICEWCSNGWFLANVVIANVAPSVPNQLHMFCRFLRDGWVPVCLLIGGLCIIRKWPESILALYAIYGVLCFPLAVFTSLKAGADMNYFLEPGFAAAILAGHGWTSLSKSMSRSATRDIVACAALVLLCEPIYYAAAWASVAQGSDAVLSKESIILRFVRELRGPVLIGDAGIAMRADKPVLLLDKFNASYLAEAERIRFPHLLALIENHQLAAVVSEVPLDAAIEQQPWWPRPIIDAVKKSFHEVKPVAGYHVFLPILKAGSSATREGYSGPQKLDHDGGSNPW
jgi:hypothetical protein